MSKKDSKTIFNEEAVLLSQRAAKENAKKQVSETQSKGISYDYEPFFKKIRKMGISKRKLSRVYNIPETTVFRMHKEEGMTLYTAIRLMKIAEIDRVEDFVIIKGIETAENVRYALDELMLCE